MTERLFEEDDLDDVAAQLRLGVDGDVAPPRPVRLTPTAPLVDLDDLADEGWDAGFDPALLTTPAAVESLGRRVRAIAFTKPLHDLEASKVRLGGDAWSRLNMVELAFHAVDVVALRMDFDTGASYEDVAAAVASLASLQVPGLADPGRVGERVVESLITGRAGSDAEAHRTAFGTWGPDGYVARRYDFALVTEHLDDAGEVYLRATDPAITVLVGALELDLEGSQQAAELRIQRLLDRGLLDAAVHEARTAKYRTIQYMDKLRRALSAARLHATEPGTLEAVDRLVDHAIEHVLERYAAEGHILAGVGRTRDAAEDDRAVRTANRLIDELRECQRRHQALQHRLMSARTDFREALANQLATPPNPPTRIDLERQLLRPLLELTLAAADRVGARAVAVTGAPRGLGMLEPDRLLEGLCALPVAHDGLGDEVGDPTDPADLVEGARPERFDDDVWDLVDSLWGDVVAPTRLSALLARAAAIQGSGSLPATVTAAPEGPGAPTPVASGVAAPVGPPDPGAVAHLLALRAGLALDPAVGERARQRDPATFLLAVRDGATFDAPTVGGDDLLLVPVGIGRPAETWGDSGSADGLTESRDGPRPGRPMDGASDGR